MWAESCNPRRSEPFEESPQECGPDAIKVAKKLIEHWRREYNTPWPLIQRSNDVAQTAFNLLNHRLVAAHADRNAALDYD